MAEYIPLEVPDNPRLAENIIHFGRALYVVLVSPLGQAAFWMQSVLLRPRAFPKKKIFTGLCTLVLSIDLNIARFLVKFFALLARSTVFEHMMSMMLPAVRGVQEERKRHKLPKNVQPKRCWMGSPPKCHGPRTTRTRMP